ncbi:MAG TPA: choice-of-anchor tandem repeat GloVer-containing protein [Rhizomicrobium sp.]|nr:choice-of-anchor tandem repeat GloVer-containing protein [Rhizomicrobium sp.]
MTSFIRSALIGAIVLAASSAIADAATETVTHSFCKLQECADGTQPVNPLVRDGAGNFYSVAPGGMNEKGVVYRLSPKPNGKWRYRVLYSFCGLANCLDGAFPGALIVDTSGRLYGMTTAGGPSNDRGTIFRLTPRAGRKAWTLETLYAFCDRANNCRDGANPLGGLTYAGASSGLPYDGTSPLYGVTELGGLHAGGVAFSLTPMQGWWKETVLHAFCAEKAPRCLDGTQLSVAPTLDGAGNLYGAAGAGGSRNKGLVYKLSPGAGHRWTETVVHDFCDGDGCEFTGNDVSKFTIDAAGDLFSLSTSGGDFTNCGDGCGVLFELSPAGALTVLHEFCAETHCPDGFRPYDAGGLLLDSSGNLFGTTLLGGNQTTDGGTAFEYSATGFTTLYKFCGVAGCTDGREPQSGLIQDPSGALWGTTTGGGAYNDQGTVFTLTP